MEQNSLEQPAPWWRHGFVWLVLSGPAAVVAAGAVTVWVAVDGADALLAEDYYRRGIEINKTLAAQRGLVPAVQGRNHAATPDARP
jgi:uncharacterized protein